jgi:hypothetical protein
MVDINNFILLHCDAAALDYQIPLFQRDVLLFFFMTHHPGSDYLMMHCDVPKEQSSVTFL